MIKLNRKQETIQALFDALDAGMDAKAFAEIERSAPGVASAIVGLVREGVEPDRIREHVVRHYPQRWIDAQTLRQAARHAAREEGER